MDMEQLVPDDFGLCLLAKVGTGTPERQLRVLSILLVECAISICTAQYP